MTFNSLEFFLFLIIVYVVYRLLNLRCQNLLLLAASYIFYGWWDVRFLFLIVASTVIDYCAGLMIDQGKMELRARIVASTWLITAALVMVTIDWSAFNFEDGIASIDEARPIFDMTGLIVLIITILAVFLSHVFYPFVTNLPSEYRRRIFLWLSVATNLGILGYFKYFNFFIDSLEVALHGAGYDPSSLRLDIILPVGISFYTFQTMSYTIDIYRRQMKPTNHFFDFALFVAYFPQLVAGPIERAKHLLPRLQEKRLITLDQTTRGLYLILLGLFKKVAIADGIALTVEQVYGSSGVITWADLLVGTGLFAVQIYCDFSGYTDIARGVSKIFGIDLLLNFRLPYFATNPQEFWRRWHISLSSWLRDYLYIGLGGNRNGRLMAYRNLMITMVLGGLWHGAAWNFVLWGIYQGGILCIYRAIPKWGKSASELSLWSPHKLVAIAFFFIVTCYGWLLFRADSLESVIELTRILFMDIGNLDLTIRLPRFSALVGLLILIVVEVLEYSYNDTRFYRRLSTFHRGALISTFLTILLMGLSNEPTQFIYFQF